MTKTVGKINLVGREERFCIGQGLVGPEIRRGCMTCSEGGLRKNREGRERNIPGKER